MSGQGKIALITGAGSGIGRASTLALLDANYTVVLAGRRPDALKGTIDLAGRNKERALAVPADVSDPAQVLSLFDTVEKTYGRLDVLFNNAGRAAAPLPLEDLPLEQWKAVIDINVTGIFMCTQAAFRLMKKQEPRGGRIINNGSISAHVPRVNSAPYTASKHAVTGLTRATSLDGRKYDIACGQIDIGNAVTEMARGFAGGVPQASGQRAPEPTMDVKHVAEAVLYMANLPLDTNVQFMTVMATKMPYIGRG